jgi:hypothetical protein
MKPMFVFLTLALLGGHATAAQPSDPTDCTTTTMATADTPIAHDCPCVHETECEAEEVQAMIPVDQTRMHDPAAGVPGNCMQAALASILELPLELVPDPTDGKLVDTPERLNAYCGRVDDLLADHNLYRFGLPEQGLPGLHLASGVSPRGVGHVVVRDGWETVHDPHPSREGLARIDRVIVLIHRDPAVRRS